MDKTMFQVNQKTRLRIKILLMTVVPFIFFILLELSLRVINFKFDIPRSMRFQNNLQVDPLIKSERFLKDPILFWRLKPNGGDFAHINSKGFRDKEFNTDKAYGVFRVICLGDSVTYGSPERLNKIEDTYPKRLEKLLNDKLGNKKFEIINAGVPGYTSYQGLQYLKKEIIKYQPNLIIVFFGQNDNQPAVYLEDKFQKMQPAWLINTQNFLTSSRLCQVLNKIVFILRKYKISNLNSKYPENKKLRVSFEDFTENLEQMVKFCKLHDIRITFIAPLYYYGSALHANSDYKFPKGSIVINLLPRFYKEGNLKKLFVDNCHFTPTGHRIASEEISTMLIKEDLIK